MAQHRHKRDTNARRTPRALQVAAPVAILMTVSAVSVGVLASDPASDTLVASSSTGSIGTAAGTALRRDVTVSRSDRREMRAELAQEREEKAEKREQRATRLAVRRADTKLWTTTELNLWSDSGDDARKAGVLDAIQKVLVTGRKADDRVEVVVDGKSMWVTAGYLTDEKPDPGPSLGGACTNGTSVPSGVSAGIVKVHSAVCANWPSVSSYGTFRGDGEHAQGRAVDIMVSGATGWDIANFLRANYAALGIEYIIYSQRIWSVDRGGEGWRGMSDRGSVTANHYDHVHVTTY